MTEYPVFVPVRNRHLAAVITVPEAQPTVLALLLTAFVSPRSHRSQMWTRTARRLAQAGIASVRVEFTGIGDSTGRREVRHGSEAGWKDALAVARFAMKATGAEQMLVIGTCGGGRYGMEIARRVPQCTGLAMVRVPRGRLRRGFVPGLIGRVRALVRILKHPGVEKVMKKVTKPPKRQAPVASDREFPRLLRRMRMLLVSGARDPLYVGYAKAYLERALPRLPKDLRGRCENVVIPGWSLESFESLELQDRIVELTTEWAIRHFAQEPNDLPAPYDPVATN